MRPGPELFYPRKRRNPTMSDEKRCTCEEDALNLGSPPCAKCFIGDPTGMVATPSEIIKTLEMLVELPETDKWYRRFLLPHGLRDKTIAHIEAQAKEIERLKDVKKHPEYLKLYTDWDEAETEVENLTAERDALLCGMREIAEEKFRTVGELRAIANILQPEADHG